MQVNEFWLNEGSAGNPIYRVTLGNLIPSTERKTFKIDLGLPELNNYAKSGSIGFMDIVNRFQCPLEERIARPSLTILAIGIEPYHEDKKHATWLLNYAETKIALLWNVTKPFGFLTST
ncbi:hypothetical protein COU54_04125 [Candidatus Pacearchaeota archaeon CG10_big_fil_rev_8_21_14_0_10_31_24]|nr:MAG: hypothetical protein COU54_04125 [Candidatus Pacearchaeota archaeon CG10_big_fil_rev_8_21_14_0_10_31_24]